MEYFLLVIPAIAILLGLFVNSRWAAGKGWVYNKHNPRPRGRGIPGSAFGQVFQPSIEHVVEEERSERVRGEVGESGDTGDT